MGATTQAPVMPPLIGSDVEIPVPIAAGEAHGKSGWRCRCAAPICRARRLIRRYRAVGRRPIRS